MSDHILSTLREILDRSPYEQKTVLTLTDEAADNLRQNLDASLAFNIDIHSQRQKLLVHRLKRSVTLLEQRNRLSQDYSTLSDTAIEQIVDATLSQIKAPLLCLPEHLDIISDRLFDLVIVEASDYLTPSQVETIARRAKKVALLGELTAKNSFLNKIFQNLFPAYRIKPLNQIL